MLPQIQEVYFPDGYDVVDGQGVVVKDLPDARSATVEAYAIWKGIRVYVSDWSYVRFRELGIPPNWIRPRGPAHLAISPPASPVIAILVGNGDYDASDSANPGSSLDLPNTLNDVDLLAKTFLRLGVQARVVKNAPLAVMKSTLAEAIETLTPETVLFFYFAGHGFQVSGENFLVPVGAHLDSPSSIAESCLSLGQLFGSLAQRDSRLAVIALDCCRENPFQPNAETGRLGRSAGPSSPSGGKQPAVGLAEVTAPANTLISFATSPGAVAADGITGEDKNSPYAAALAKALARDLEIRDAFETAGREVKALSGGDQIPWKSNDSFSEFYLCSPHRRVATPDSFVLLASRAMADSGDFGVPKAIAYLAASVRENPRNSPSCFALAYLLAYNAIPIPIQRVSQKGFDPQGERLTIGDGRATLGPLILRSRELTASEAQAAPAVTDVTEERFVNSGGYAAFQLAKAQPAVGVDASAAYSLYAVTPVKLRGRMESIIYLPKPRRIVFDEHVYDGWSVPLSVHVHEMATTAPVRLRTETENSFRAVSTWQVSDSVTSPLGGSGLAVTIRGNHSDTVISVHPSQESPSAWTSVSPGKDGYTRFLGYSAPNEQIALAIGYTEGEHPLDTLCLVPLGSPDPKHRTQRFTSNFIEVSPDGEWLFTYDKLHRPVLFDFATGGEAVHLIGTRCNEPLPIEIPLGSEAQRPATAPSGGVPAPSLFEWLPDLYHAPPWLPDLAESIVGFRVTRLGDTERFEDSGSRMRDLQPILHRKIGCNPGFQMWTDWMLQNRLSALLDSE